MTEAISDYQARLLDNPELVDQMERTAAGPRVRAGRPQRERTVDAIAAEPDDQG